MRPLSDGRSITIERKVIEVSQMYYECADKHEALAEAVKEPMTLP